MSAALDEVAREAAKCVTCGLCNQVCPTFATTRRETDGPRGRVHFLLELARGGDTAGLVFLDPCLRCDLCSEVCPTAVDFGGAVRSYRAAAGIAPRGLDDLAAFAHRPGLDLVEAQYFAALLATASGTRKAAPAAGVHATALVPGPLLAALRPEVVAAARRRHAPDAAVLTVDPGTGLLELGLDGEFAAAAVRFAEAVRTHQIRDLVCLDPWSVTAAERALRGAGIDVTVSNWPRFLAGVGYVLEDDGALLLDWGPEPLEDMRRLAPAVPPERILSAELRGHVSLPVFDASGRAVQRRLRERASELASDRRIVTSHPLTLLAHPRAEFAGAGSDGG